MEKCLQVVADERCIGEAFSFVEGMLETVPGCSRVDVLKFHMIVDEIFSNIAKYAYEEERGQVFISFFYDEAKKNVILIFRDDGQEYDPTKKEDPDISLPASERSIGGLGIFMVKNTVDEFMYERKDGWNVLTLIKTIGGTG